MARPYHCVVAETVERHFTVEANSKHDAAFKLAMAISADPPTIEHDHIGRRWTQTHISPVIADPDED